MHARRLVAGAAAAIVLAVPVSSAYAATPLPPTTVPPAFCQNLPTIQARVAAFESNLDGWVAHLESIVAGFTGPQHDAIAAAASQLEAKIAAWKAAIDARMAEINAACASSTPSA